MSGDNGRVSPYVCEALPKVADTARREAVADRAGLSSAVWLR